MAHGQIDVTFHTRDHHRIAHGQVGHQRPVSLRTHKAIFPLGDLWLEAAVSQAQFQIRQTSSRQFPFLCGLTPDTLSDIIQVRFLLVQQFPPVLEKTRHFARQVSRLFFKQFVQPTRHLRAAFDRFVIKGADIRHIAILTGMKVFDHFRNPFLCIQRRGQRVSGHQDRDEFTTNSRHKVKAVCFRIIQDPSPDIDIYPDLSFSQPTPSALTYRTDHSSRGYTGSSGLDWTETETFDRSSTQTGPSRHDSSDSTLIEPRHRSCPSGRTSGSTDALRYPTRVRSRPYHTPSPWPHPGPCPN